MCNGGLKGVAETSERRECTRFIIVPRHVAFDLSHRSTIKIFNPQPASAAERTSLNRMQMPPTIFSTGIHEGERGCSLRNILKISPDIVQNGNLWGTVGRSGYEKKKQEKPAILLLTESVRSLLITQWLRIFSDGYETRRLRKREK